MRVRGTKKYEQSAGRYGRGITRRGAGPKEYWFSGTRAGAHGRLGHETHAGVNVHRN
jgi:hypothetical protein